MPRRLALIPILLALSLTSAQALEPNLSMSSGSAPGAPSRLVLAQRLFRQASQAGDPVLLLAAIRLARGVALRPAPGWKKQPPAETGPQDRQGPAEPHDPASPEALAVLQGLVADDPDLQDLVYDLDAQLPHGRLPVATVASSELDSEATETWRLPLSGSVTAEIGLLGDNGSLLGLMVSDDSGAVVCRRPASADPALCRFTPARNGFFTILISNAGPGWARYRLVGN